MKAISDKKTKRFKKAIKIVLALAVVVAVFFAGFFTYYLTLDDSIRSLIWVKDKIESHYYDGMTDEEFLEAATDGVDNALDAYSTYYTPAEYEQAKASSQGSQEGIGISFLTANGNMFVYKVAGNSPAEEAGIQAGMYVIGFGTTEEAITYSSAYEDFLAFFSEIPNEQPFVLVVAENADGRAARAYTVQRKAYTENYVCYSSNASAYRFGGEKALDKTAYDGAIEALPDDTAYIRFSQFAGNAAKQMELALEIFRSEGKTNLILDLRNNGGGDMEVLRGVASFFLKEAEGNSPVVAVARYSDGREEKFRAKGNAYGEYFSDESRITVLANVNTASASECLLGAMLDYGTIAYSDIYLSELNGRAKTYGKGIMQTTYYNALQGDAIKITTARIFWPLSDVCIHGVGITDEDGANAVKASGYVSLFDKELHEVIELIK